MNISSVPDSLLNQIGNSATQTGDAVSVSVMRKALDIQSTQASQLIESVKQSVPDPSSRLGQNINVKA
jgi:hypothetical protein